MRVEEERGKEEGSEQGGGDRKIQILNLTTTSSLHLSL